MAQEGFTETCKLLKMLSKIEKYEQEKLTSYCNFLMCITQFKILNSNSTHTISSYGMLNLYYYIMQQNKQLFLLFKEIQVTPVNLNMLNLDLSLKIFYHPPFSGERK
jgi:hypothetical protein